MDGTNEKLLKMTQTPIPRLVVALGIPTTISMLITNIYNMADSYFVSKIDVSAGGATSIVFGIMAILQAFGFMFGHGAGSKISRLLGQRDTKTAGKYASTGFFAGLGCGIIIMLLGLILLEPLMYFLGSTDTILPYAKDYGMWILIAAPAMVASCVLNNILRYEGQAPLAMIGLTTGGILNIMLDPVFIFGLDLGITGAGLATAISQYISFFILLSMFLRGKTQSTLRFLDAMRSWRVFWDICIIGLPSFARQGLNSISTMVLNTQARAFGDDAAIAAMGYVSRTAFLVFSVGLGIGQGFQPVAGFNYGAKKYDRVKSATLFTLALGTALIGIIAIFCAIFAPQVIGLFGEGEVAVVEIGALALRLYCIALIFFPVSVVVTMLFQSIGKSVPALILSTLHGGVLFIPLCLILPRYIDFLGIQLAQPISYIVSAIVALPPLVLFLRGLKDESVDKEETL